MDLDPLSIVMEIHLTFMVRNRSVTVPINFFQFIRGITTITVI